MLRFSWFWEWQVICDCILDIVDILLWNSGAYLKILFKFQTSSNTVSVEERNTSLLPGTGVSPSSPNGLLWHWRVWGVSRYCWIRVKVQDPTRLPSHTILAERRHLFTVPPHGLQWHCQVEEPPYLSTLPRMKGLTHNITFSDTIRGGGNVHVATLEPGYSTSLDSAPGFHGWGWDCGHSFFCSVWLG